MLPASSSRFVVGIDLGTTNSALAFVDVTTPEGEREPQLLAIPQLVGAGEVDALPLLPSFVYLPAPGEVDPELLRLPWSGARPPEVAVGSWARSLAAGRPDRVVASAKSWLCVEEVDRRAPLLPWDRESLPRRISPLEAIRLVLEHLRDAWDHSVAAADPSLVLARQDVFLTVPASFDAVARQLTAEAAEAAGLAVRLLEEPQAALYAWLEEHGDGWRRQLAAGDSVLVCDLGGGTTDFTLVAAVERGGTLELERVAVGEHILLGGDNMDLALAYGVAGRLERERDLRLDGAQLAALAHACRAAKERLAAEGGDQVAPLAILGRGRSVIGGSVSTELRSGEVEELLLDGFFPRCERGESPAARRRVGLRTFGLDYATDPAVTRHLAAFLAHHPEALGAGGEPSAVLFNGGVTRSSLVRRRIVETLSGWRSGDSGHELRVLTGTDPDLAVARGAAWYGAVRRLGGVRIRAGSARSYYLGVESARPAVPGFALPVEALCVVPFGMEEGSSAAVPAEGIGLVVGEPTEFRCFSSTVRPEDRPGTLLAAWSDDELTELPPLAVELPADEASAVGALVPVALEAELTAVGTLALWCRDRRPDGERRWRLDFELRQGT